MGDELESERPKRQKRESSFKKKAFERFKQLKSGNRNKYEVEEVENVYDTVDEREYTKKVLSRQDDDWIVDDDGSGYVEDGRDIFDDDLDQESIAAASSSKSKGVKRKKKVAENAGKGNLEALIGNMTSRKEDKKLHDDETLAELLQELQETPSNTPLRPRKTVENFTTPVRQTERAYMNNLASSVLRKMNLNKSGKVIKVAQRRLQQEKTAETESAKETATEKITILENRRIDDFASHTESGSVETAETDTSEMADLPVAEDSCFDDDLDFSQVEDSITEAPTVDFDEMLKNWTNDIPSEADTSINLENTDIPVVDVDGKKVFRFFWWDAYENVYKQPGVVFLFGKTYHEPAKKYISCCVVVRNVERRIFFLPRIQDKESGKTVTSQDVYKEINESVMKGLYIKNFKARPVTKKYAFNPDIPVSSDYIEVRYAAKDPPVARMSEGRTYSKVFGTENSYLEILLLDKKIKGPCWLDISNAGAVTNPVTWCKLEINCNSAKDISIAKDVHGKPPLTVSSINLRTIINPKTGSTEIVMLSCVTNNQYYIDKKTPNDNPFQKHFCAFTCPDPQVGFALHNKMATYKATTLQKMHSEKALLNYFITQLFEHDPDLIVGHDMQGYQISILVDRIYHHAIPSFSKLGRIKRSLAVKPKLERELFVGRLVCDIKISAKELIKSRSYDLDSLCQTVLSLNDGQRIELEPEEISRMFESSDDILKLVALTMQDTAYILRIMYQLNIIPLALQITNIAGNVMSKTLMGGRSERNEFLLLHAFSEKDYIVPDKIFAKKKEEAKSTRKKATYSGGLVLDPKIGFYDKLILLMDFNSLYPSIIQEYNICFTTMPPEFSDANMVLPDSTLKPGILPTEIRKLVESRREVKKLMNNPDLSTDLRQQYNTRQMALKLTANSMYGCLGFSNSRFYAKDLAALITHKGREILTNTKEVVERMNFEVIYGDTDSLMINTNIIDFDQVSTIGHKIKQEINKMYKQVELDIDGVFKYLLLLKKKKYAAVTIAKTKNNQIKTEVEYKGLDIVRRDWSRLSAEVGKFTLEQILSDQGSDDRVGNILNHLRKVREELEANLVPLSLLVITKQLSKNPKVYKDAHVQPHVQVALRYNSIFGGHFRAGDTVPYIICEDTTNNVATQRAYHIEELKTNSQLKIDVRYYLTQQILPVVSRICGPIEELDLYQLAECLGLESKYIKRTTKTEFKGENVTKVEVRFRNCKQFVFKCLSCKSDNSIDQPFFNNIPVLEKCSNSHCKVKPVDYIGNIQNQMVRAINLFAENYYSYDMYCEDPMCDNDLDNMPLRFSDRYPICDKCNAAVLLKHYKESDLYHQILFYKYIFDLSKWPKKPTMEYRTEKAYNDLKETAAKIIDHCGFAKVDLNSVFSKFTSNYVEPVEYVEESLEDNFISDNEL